MIILFHFRSEREFHADTLCRKHFVSALESVRQILLTEEREIDIFETNVPVVNLYGG